MRDNYEMSAGDPLNFVPWHEDFVNIVDQADRELNPVVYAQSWSNLKKFADNPYPALDYCATLEDTETFTRTIAYDLATVAVLNSTSLHVSEGFFAGEGMKRFRFKIDMQGERLNCVVTDKMPGRTLMPTVDAYMPLQPVGPVSTNLMNATRHPRRHGEKIKHFLPAGAFDKLSHEAQKGYLFCVHELVTTLVEVTPYDLAELDQAA